MPLTKKMWLVVGAGISFAAPANIPLWASIKDHFIKEILENLAAWDQNKWHNEPDRYSFLESISTLQAGMTLPEETMACLCRAFGEDTIRKQLSLLIQPHGSRPNACHRAIARLARSGHLNGIITTNYDRLLEEAFLEEGILFQVVLPDTVPKSAPLPIIKVHGTIERSESLCFLQHAYFKGFSAEFAQALEAHLSSSSLVICGYSGNDSDLFPCWRALSKIRTMRSQLLTPGRFAVILVTGDFAIRSSISKYQAKSFS